MNMKIVNCVKQLCVCCMEEHEVKTVLIKEQATFKNTVVNYDALYSYCDIAEELFANKQQLQDNDIKLKDAYRAKKGLLTTDQIKGIREKYGISQSDLCVLLGWGENDYQI